LFSGLEVAPHDLGVELKLLCLAQWLKKEGVIKQLIF
jgi:hypothetical protein